MGKMYAGNIPNQLDGWMPIGACKEQDGVEWLVFKKPQTHTPDWFTYKIVANGRAREKANYWLVRNIQDGKIGFSRDYVLLRENRPDIHAQVEAILKGSSRRQAPESAA